MLAAGSGFAVYLAHVEPFRILLAIPGKVPYVPRSTIGDGGEASVCALGAGKAAKLHKKASLEGGRAATLQRKVASLINIASAVRNSAALRNVIWPEAQLFDGAHFVGYVMRRVGGTSLHMVLRDRSWRPDERLQLALQISRQFGALHSLGLAVGDPSANNILAARGPSGPEAYLIDADSFHLPNFPCLVSTQRYVIPAVHRGTEVWRAGPDADRYALSFLLFELLLGGVSPFAHKGGGAPEENAAKELFAYAVDQSLVPEGPWLQRWQALPDALRALFSRAFVPGNRRPMASEWTATLASTALSPVWAELQTNSPTVTAAAGGINTKRRFLERLFSRRRTA